MDIRMPRLDGIEAARRIMALGPGSAKVVMLTTFDLDEYVFDALGAGATGFLMRPAWYAGWRVCDDGVTARSARRGGPEGLRPEPVTTLDAAQRCAVFHRYSATQTSGACGMMAGSRAVIVTSPRRSATPSARSVAATYWPPQVPSSRP